MILKMEEIFREDSERTCDVAVGENFREDWKTTCEAAVGEDIREDTERIEREDGFENGEESFREDAEGTCRVI